MPAPRQTRSEKDRAHAYHALAETLRGLEEDLRWGLEDSLRIPRAWTEIANGPAIPKKTKLTLRLDEDIVAFFRTMGMGHLSRMNAVLRAFMLARLAGVVTGPEAVHYAPTPEEEERSLRREILDAARAEIEAREAAAEAMSETEKRKARIEELKRLRDARKGRG
jgi:uncharacterized protein (DUF4415 family)